MKPTPIPCCRRNEREDAELQTQRNELAGERIFAACFKAVFFGLAIAETLLGKLSRWIKRN